MNNLKLFEANKLNTEIEYLEGILKARNKITEDIFPHYKIIRMIYFKAKRLFKIKVNAISYVYEYSLDLDQFKQIDDLLYKFIKERYNILIKEFNEL